MQAHSGHRRSLRAALGAVAFLLLAAMAMHAVEPHEHPAFAFGEGVVAAMHGLARGFSTVIPPVAVVTPVFPADETVPALMLLMAASLPLAGAFRRGIVHPKLCG